MSSVVEQITSLIDKDVGDPYRLEHIKSRLEQNKDLTKSDTKYLRGLLALSNLRNVENEQHQRMTTKPTSPPEESSEFNYCWNCNTKNPFANAFCTNCEASINNSDGNSEKKKPKSVPIIRRIRKELVILGFIIMIFGSSAFIVPFGDTPGIVNDMNSFCWSVLGLIIQGFYGEQGPVNCTYGFQLLLLADFLELGGIVLIILGLTIKKTEINFESQFGLKN
ncbi:MAG: hypothetical protein ACE5DL_02120 [Nitrosopumilaceae archaeon]